MQPFQNVQHKFKETYMRKYENTDKTRMGEGRG
jgi:hypothetical protein